MWLTSMSQEFLNPRILTMLTLRIRGFIPFLKIYYVENIYTTSTLYTELPVDARISVNGKVLFT